MNIAPALLLLVVQSRVITLDEALKTAEAGQPQLRQAHAQSDAAEARVKQSFAPLLPEVKTVGLIERTTGNRNSKPTRPLIVIPAPSWQAWDFFNFGVGVSQTVWDSGQSWNRWRAAKESVEAQRQTEQLTKLQVVLLVRTTYFSAWAQKAMVGVGRSALANQERHLGQIAGFVEVGTRPQIDLAQARADRANAKVMLIDAESAYASAKAALNQAMGVTGSIDYDVAEEGILAVPGEDGATAPLVERALGARPELAVLHHQVSAQLLRLKAIRGAYFPTLTASAVATDAGTDLGQMAWNVGGLLTLTWPLFQGFLTVGQEREGRASLAALGAAGDLIVQQIWSSVEQAQVAVQAAKERLVAAEEAATAAGERLRLAEGRYETGVGNAIELGDAQLGFTAGEAQQVQAAYNLASARARLLAALGRP
jgi:outer membrane protein